MRAGAFGLTEDLVYRKVQRCEVAQGILRNRSSSREAALRLLQPQCFLDLAQHQRVRTTVCAWRPATVAVLKSAAVLCAHRFGPGRQDLLHPGGGAAHLRHLLLNLFPDSRNAEEERRSHFLQSGGEGTLQRIRLCKVCARSNAHHGVEVEHLRSNVRQWKVRDVSILVIEVHVMISDVLRGPSNVVVGYHRSFRGAGGARSVDESRAISGFNFMAARIDCTVTLHTEKEHTLTSNECSIKTKSIVGAVYLPR